MLNELVQPGFPSTLRGTTMTGKQRIGPKANPANIEATVTKTPGIRAASVTKHATSTTLAREGSTWLPIHVI